MGSLPGHGNNVKPRKGSKAREHAIARKNAWKAKNPPSVNGTKEYSPTKPHPSEVRVTPKDAVGKMSQGSVSRFANAVRQVGARHVQAATRKDGKVEGIGNGAGQAAPLDFSGLKIAEVIGAASRVFL